MHIKFNYKTNEFGFQLSNCKHNRMTNWHFAPLKSGTERYSREKLLDRGFFAFLLRKTFVFILSVEKLVNMVPNIVPKIAPWREANSRLTSASLRGRLEGRNDFALYLFPWNCSFIHEFRDPLESSLKICTVFLNLPNLEPLIFWPINIQALPFPMTILIHKPTHLSYE